MKETIEMKMTTFLTKNNNTNNNNQNHNFNGFGTIEIIISNLSCWLTGPYLAQEE